MLSSLYTYMVPGKEQVFDLIREIRKFGPGRHHAEDHVVHIEHYNDMILRDHLAADRTAMSNEQSLLAYIRTSLTLLIAGASGIKLFTEVGVKALGAVFVSLSILTFVMGVKSYRRMSRRLAQVRIRDYDKSKIS